MKANEQKSKYDHRAAVLACVFSDSTHAFSGGLDTVVRAYVLRLSFSPRACVMLLCLYSSLDLETETISPVGEHKDAISAMNFSRDESA